MNNLKWTLGLLQRQPAPDSLCNGWAGAMVSVWTCGTTELIQDHIQLSSMVPSAFLEYIKYYGTSIIVLIKVCFKKSLILGDP